MNTSIILVSLLLRRADVEWRAFLTTNFQNASQENCVISERGTANRDTTNQNLMRLKIPWRVLWSAFIMNRSRPGTVTKSDGDAFAI